jgi:hypothetical protein
MNSGLEEVTLPGVVPIPIGHSVIIAWLSSDGSSWADPYENPVPRILDCDSGVEYSSVSLELQGLTPSRELRGIVRRCLVLHQPEATLPIPTSKAPRPRLLRSGTTTILTIELPIQSPGYR